jgi:tRNA uridine 5-carboxymethylaminomethyl modification enzyme
LLRQDNADVRLTEIGRRLGLVPDEQYAAFLNKRDTVDREVARLNRTRPKWTDAFRKKLGELGLEGITPDLTLAQLLKRQELSYQRLMSMTDETGITEDKASEAIEITVKYEGYVKRQLQQVHQFQKLEERRIPMTFDYDAVTGFSREVLEKFKKVKPASIGQASRISGITPAAISLLIVALERERRKNLPSAAAS